jgi:hypothetical protein
MPHEDQQTLAHARAVLIDLGKRGSVAPQPWTNRVPRRETIPEPIAHAPHVNGTAITYACASVCPSCGEAMRGQCVRCGV